MSQISLLISSVSMLVLVFGFLCVGLFLWSGGLEIGASLISTGMMAFATGAKSVSDSANAEKRENSKLDEVVKAFRERIRKGNESGVVAYNLNDKAVEVLERMSKATEEQARLRKVIRIACCLQTPPLTISCKHLSSCVHVFL